MQEALQSLERDVVRQILAASLDDKALHTRLVMNLQANARVGNHLWMLMVDGTSARGELQMRGRRLD